MLAKFPLSLLHVVALTTVLLLVPSAAAGEEPARGAHAVLVQNVGPGLIRDLHALLTTRYRYPTGNVAVFGSSKHLLGLSPAAPSTKNILSALDRLADELVPGDQVLVVFLCHMQKGCLINDRIPYAELNEHLARFRRGVKVAIVAAGCHSGGAIPVLEHADIVYTGGTSRQKTYGGFLHFLRDALGRKAEAFDAADVDGDGGVSLGEAFDYASDAKRLEEWYDALPDEIWPTKMVPTPMRWTRSERMDYKMWPSPRLAAPEEE